MLIVYQTSGVLVCVVTPVQSGGLLIPAPLTERAVLFAQLMHTRKPAKPQEIVPPLVLQEGIAVWPTAEN